GYFGCGPDLPLSSLPFGSRVKGGVRLRLKSTAGLNFSDLTLDRLPVYLGGREDVANSLYELAFGAGLGALVLPPGRPPEWLETPPPSAARPPGLPADCAPPPRPPPTSPGR